MPLRKLTSPAVRTDFAYDCKLPWKGNPRAPIMVVVDPVILKEEGSYSDGKIPTRFLQAMAPHMKAAGIKGEDCVFVSATSPLTKAVWESDTKLAAAVKADNENFQAAYRALRPKLVIVMGKAAARQVYDRAVKITKVRGLATYDEKLGVTVMPCLGVAHILRVPEHEEVFAADLREAGRIVANDFNYEQPVVERNYQWCFDLKPVMDLIAQNKLTGKRTVLGLDTESSSFGHSDFPHWYVKQTKVLTVQISVREGESLVVPLNYPGMPISRVRRVILVQQLKRILEDPTVQCVGHNLKHDWLQLYAKHNISFTMADDTLLIAHMLNENMLNKGLEEVARIHIPEVAGHKDAFTRKGYDKGRMDLVSPEDILEYSGADSDIVLRLRRILLPVIQKDKKLYNCYQRVVMPAIRAFCDIERGGFKINRTALEALRVKIDKHQKAEYKHIVSQIPKAIIDKYKETGVGIKLNRAVLLKDWLFEHEAGFKFKPLQFTKTGQINVSSKTHLPYFLKRNPVIARLIAFIKNDKMLTGFVGEDGHVDETTGTPVAPTGFWKYIFDEYVRPSYLLHGTVTGRSSSRDPNGQNFPKRGDFAKEYRAVFEAPEGYVLIEADYSQLELRVAGILAEEPTFLKIYREGGDIHCSTAAVVMGISLEAFMKLKTDDPETFALMRYRAKAVNFGFIYGMGWRKFVMYAKTEYNIDYTDDEAKRIRAAFFDKYSAIEGWHIVTKNFVREKGYVRALDGRIRHLPAVTVDDDGVAASAERQAVNSPVQGFGSDLGLIALTRINAELPYDLVRVVGFVHDALICIAPIGREMEAARAIKHYMETNPLEEWFNFKSPIPLLAEVSIGMNLAKMIEVKDKWLNNPEVTSFADLKALDDRGKAEADAAKAAAKAATGQPRLRMLPSPNRPGLRRVAAPLRRAA